MRADDDASSNRSWSLVGSKHGPTVIPGDSSNVEVKYLQQQWDRSEYPGGLTPVGHPKDFTPGFMVCYTTRGGSENDCHCPNLIVEITGLPLSDPDMTFLVDTHKIERVEDIKSIVQWWVSEGCVDHGLEATGWIPKSHWVLHSIERATPHKIPEEDGHAAQVFLAHLEPILQEKSQQRRGLTRPALNGHSSRAVVLPTLALERLTFMVGEKSPK